MKRCLLLSSLLMVCLTLMAQDYLLPLGGRRQYRVCITAKDAVVTGICIVKTDADGSRGTLVNEFGIHALDFSLSADRKQVKLQRVMAAMDHWYVRRVVRKDLRLLFGATAEGEQSGKRVVTSEPDGTVVLTNKKYKLKYSFKEINETAE